MRILWLLNQTGLRDSEVPMLISMGYEVFCPKSYSVGYGDLNASVTYAYDSSLSVPEQVLSQLNETDFFAPIPARIRTLLNRYFDICFCTSAADQVKETIRFFKGKIVVRWLGTRGHTSFTSLYYHDTLEMLKSCGNRFWFGIGYEHLAENECSYLKNRSIYLPFSIRNDKNRQQWTGGDRRFLFWCPEIMTDPSQTEIYRQFKKDFRGFSYVICGQQIQAVPNDETVAGFLPEGEYASNMSHLACMFFHSKEDTWLPLQAAEALCLGMPVVFMQGSLLEKLSNGAPMPGMCKSIREAKRKIKRLCDGDRQFADTIIQSQNAILPIFSEEYCSRRWKDGLTRITAGDHNKAGREKKKRIGLILPLPYTGGVLEVAKRLALSLKRGIDEYGSNAELVFGYPKDPAMEENPEINEMKDNGILCREFVSAEISQRQIERVLTLKGFRAEDGSVYHYGDRCVPDDRIDYFNDCDYLIYVVDRSGGMQPLFSEKPYAMIVHDVVQRYVPDSIPEEYRQMIITCYRECDHLFALSVPTKEDCIQYACIEERKVSVLPLMYELADTSDYDWDSLRKELDIEGKDYFVWSTNLNPHKNHIRTLKALIRYYENGGKLECYITGSRTQFLEPAYAFKTHFIQNPYVNSIHEIIVENEVLGEHLHFVGNLKKDRYFTLLKNARFFFHPGYADNGNMAFLDAASFGVPTLSHDYPAMRYSADFTGIPVHFMNAFEQKCILAGIEYMENHRDELAARLPSVEQLQRKTVQTTWKSIYDEICAVVGVEVTE